LKEKIRFRDPDNSFVAPLVRVTRGEVTECIHYGHVAVVRDNGELLASVGTPDMVTYMRSAAKPIQAMAVLESGAADQFGFSDSEIAVMCASHYGEPIHLETVLTILARIGCTPDDLQCGAATSLNPTYAMKMAREGVEPAALFNDCSGKHAGILALCTRMDWPLETYLEPEHPAQKTILETLARMACLPPASIAIGIDGCSVPVFALPLSSMARAYARLASPDSLEERDRQAAERIVRAMTTYPEMIAGTGGFCTALLSVAGHHLVGKLGAEGIYCIGLREKNLGIALKISDGAFRAVWPAAVACLDQLGVLSEEESQALQSFRTMANRNDVGKAIGTIEPIFKLA